MKISVVIPAHNARSTILPAIASVLDQTLPPYEVIVVDDGSPDDTFMAVVSSPLRDRVILIAQSHEGEAAAVNTGIRAARGDYIALQHADDVSLPNRFERQSTLARPGRVVGCWAQGEGGPDLVWGGAPSDCHMAFMGCAPPIPCPTMLAPADIWRAFPWDVAWDGGTIDMEVMGRMLDSQVEFVALRERLYVYRWPVRGARESDPASPVGPHPGLPVLARHREVDCRLCGEEAQTRLLVAS